MKLQLKVGSTSQRIFIFVQDSSKTDGSGLAGLAYNTSSLVWYVARDDDGNAGGTSVTLATATKGTFTSGGFVEKDSTNLPGVYELGIPNTALASGSKSCVMMLKGATNMAPVLIEIELVAYDPFDTVRLGLTALPNAAAEASGGLYTRGTGAGQINQDGNGRIDVNLKAILGTVLTETAGLLAGGFKKFFNVATPTGTLNDLPGVVPGANGGLPTVDANNAVKVQSGTGSNQISLSSGLVRLSSTGVDDILDRTDGVETSFTLRQALRLILAACAGKASGLGTTTAKYRNQADSKDRISATVDSDGNRTAVTVDVS